MRRLFIALVLILSLTAAPAQVQPQETPFQHLISVREKLIKRYVLQTGYVRSVSVCGDIDLVYGIDNSWLTIYVYSDSVVAFSKDFIINEMPQIDVYIVVEQIERKAPR